MIERDENIDLLRQWMAYYKVDPAGNEYIKVLHYAMANYGDDEIEDAVAHIRDRYEPTWRQPPPPAQQQQTVTAPAEEQYTVGTVTVVLQSRSFQHIPPSLWESYRTIVRSGSLATKIKEAGTTIIDWLEVMSTSDEQFDFSGQRAGIRTRASWNGGQLVIYHAHPDLPRYDTYFTV